jgi:hypothetical protein
MVSVGYNICCFHFDAVDRSFISNNICDKAYFDFNLQTHLFFVAMVSSKGFSKKTFLS